MSIAATGDDKFLVSRYPNFIPENREEVRNRENEIPSLFLAEASFTAYDDNVSRFLRECWFE